jgi:CRP-like cAMP-binding protein
LRAIPIFEHLDDDEVRKIYGICQVMRFEPDHMIYQFGHPSDSVFILLDGQLVARTKTGVDIAYISPIGLVGEMGVITDEVRSADVVTLDQSMGFQISKDDLVKLFMEDGGVCRKILLNMVKNLSTKLYDTNGEIEKLREAKVQKEREDGVPHKQTTSSYIRKVFSAA